MENLCRQNRTIMSTIHQPSPEVFSLFNKVVLMVAGRLVFFGPSDRAVEYFTKPELGYEYNPKRNPAEFIIDVCGGKVLPKDKDQAIPPEQLEILYENSDFYRPVNSAAVAAKQVPVKGVLHHSSPLTQFKMLMHRGWLAQTRDTPLLIAMIMKNLIVGPCGKATELPK